MLQCPIAHAAAKARYYEKNKEEMKRRAREWTDKTRAYHHKLIARYKLIVGCKVCGYKKCGKALELHHVVNDKDDHISDMIHSGSSTMRIKKEIRKCIILCANCHRELHANIIKIDFVANYAH